jgi:hypothetical protein
MERAFLAPSLRATMSRDPAITTRPEGLRLAKYTRAGFGRLAPPRLVFPEGVEVTGRLGIARIVPLISAWGLGIGTAGRLRKTFIEGRGTEGVVHTGLYSL